MPAAAMTWAISPPMVPAPTTAALKTNMRAGRLPVGLVIRPQLIPEAEERASQRVGERAADEQEVEEERERPALLQPVRELERDLDALGDGGEPDGLGPVDLLVLDLDGLAGAGLVGAHALADAP